MEDILNQRLEELPHNRYDIVSKHIFGTFTEDLLRALTKIPGLKFLEQLETELPTVEIRRMDVLAKTLVEEQEVLVHIEFQVSRETRAEILQRKVGYFGRCFERYGLPILSYIIYLSPDAGQNDPGGYSQEFPGHKIEIEYQVIRLSELEGQSIFETGQTSLMAFAPLMRPRAGVSAVEWVKECHQITRALSLEPELQNAIRKKMMSQFAEYGLGSGNLLPRHEKALHWNVDFLLDLQSAELISILAIRSPERLENRIAKQLERDPRTDIIEPGLGANDARGATHLLRFRADDMWWASFVETVGNTCF
ncbi:DUF123 domain-containing protein [Candidatus Poribacteria bacterium]|nr:DUF123 domain-containing protein [Candidatus Poribacteria bacterium]MYH80187.1 DUF123 domain-containing protein [Candidatus Poribacteria bacterium]MYK92824.1 DUF123 domain-containing protein [Candidatus Poribacteria bacterium]